MAIEAERGKPYTAPSQADSWVFFEGDFHRYRDVHLGLMTHALHYGTGCFEGIRGYWNEAQEQLFCVLMRDHYVRLLNSAKILKLEVPHTVDEMISFTVEILRRNGYREDVYVRPIVFKSAEEIGVRLHNLKSSFGIYTAPFGNYVDVDNGIRCMVSSWRRVDDNAAPARAKITGIYVNSALAKTEAQDNGFDEAIVLTHDGHVSEGSAENIFIVRDGVAITPPETDNILEGVTRKILIKLMRDDFGLQVIERSIDRSELYVSDEIFLCGTGAQVSPVLDVDRRQIGTGAVGPITKDLQRLYFDICKGRVEEKLDWLTGVYSPRTADPTGRVVVAPNAFKGSLTAAEAARAIAEGLRRAEPGIDCALIPLSDGGDGFLETLMQALGLVRHKVVVRGPLHAPVVAAIGLSRGAGGKRLAVIESAQAIGIVLLDPAHRDPLGASSGGVGELLAEARQLGATRFLAGVGGSAGTDGGTGMARALGYRFLDSSGRELPEGGGPLRRLARIDASGFDPSWLLLQVTVACDVDNPLTGNAGAARVYAPQKGATAQQVAILEAGLERLAEVVRRDLGVDIERTPGAGAAGGLGGGLKAFLGAELRPGAPAVIEAVGLREALQAADLMVTGEGRLDAQSLSGKAPVAAGREARAAGVRAVALVGSTGDGWQRSLGDAFDQVDVITPGGLTLAVAVTRTRELLTHAAERLLGPNPRI